MKPTMNNYQTNFNDDIDYYDEPIEYAHEESYNEDDY
jgi:hypothetical protein